MPLSKVFVVRVTAFNYNSEVHVYVLIPVRGPVTYSTPSLCHFCPVMHILDIHQMCTLVDGAQMC